MKFKVWEEGIKRENGDVLLRLFQMGSKVLLCIVNEKGDNEWYVADLVDGVLKTACAIGDNEFSEGLKLDCNGNILVDIDE